MTLETESNETSGRAASVPWWAYVAPMAVFLGVTFLEGAAPKSYVWIYIVKVIAVSAALVVCRTAWRDIRIDRSATLPGIVVGLIVLAIWIVGEKWIPYPHLGNRSAFDPFTSIGDPSARIAFLISRFFGLVVMVPVMEELFWRSFLIRYVTNPEWRSLRPWEFSWQAFCLVAAGFALSHPEWLVAALCAAAYGLLLKQTRSLFSCVVAHGTTNLGLGVYVLSSGAWQLW